MLAIVQVSSNELADIHASSNLSEVLTAHQLRFIGTYSNVIFFFSCIRPSDLSADLSCNMRRFVFTPKFPAQISQVCIQKSLRHGVL
jgi:hypothetical protein